MSKDLDWIEELFESEPISNMQIAVIEGLLSSVPYDPESIRDIENGLLHLSYNEASELIKKLKDDYIDTDPREQFKKMFRNGS